MDAACSTLALALLLMTPWRMHLAHAQVGAVTPAPEPVPRTTAASRYDERSAAFDDQVVARIGLLLKGDDTYIEHEEEGLRHARAIANMSPKEQHQKSFELVREAARGTINSDHEGDTHKFFNAIDSSKDEHLSDVELLDLMGPDPNNVTHLGVFDKIRRQMASSVKVHMDQDKDGKVHRDEFYRALHQGGEL